MPVWIKVQVHTATSTDHMKQYTMTKSNNQKTRLVKFFAKTQEATSSELANRCSIANVSAVIAELRHDGHVIWTNRYKNKKTGKPVFKYRYDAKRTAANLR